jgi:hypothetical protein
MAEVQEQPMLLLVLEQQAQVAQFVLFGLE